MFRPRVIPVLLLKGFGLVKTQKFSKPNYIGDPINAVRIFNDLEADELVFLDITATNENRIISVDLVKKLGDEAYMPFAVGGGIKTVDSIGEMFRAGAEKVILNSSVATDFSLISKASDTFGNQSIVVSIDVKRNILGNYQVFINSGTKKINCSLLEYVKEVESAGAGEIFINSIDHDGMMNGYDLKLIKIVSDSVGIPVISAGGASCINDFIMAYSEGGASAVAAGSLFVYHGPRKAVLINYPSKEELNKSFNQFQI